MHYIDDGWFKIKCRNVRLGIIQFSRFLFTEKQDIIM